MSMGDTYHGQLPSGDELASEVHVLLSRPTQASRASLGPALHRAARGTADAALRSGFRIPAG